MENAGRFALGLAGLLGLAALGLWFIWTTLRQSEDAARLAFKWVVTGLAAALLIGLAVSLHRAGVAGGIAAAVAAAACGVFLGILWAPHLGAALAKPLTSFYDGGSEEAEARPFYAIARAKQKRGNYPEAIAAVRQQLARFPEDYEGWMLLAEIYASDLKDHAAAQNCIEEILRHEGHAPKNIAFALNRAADWHLGFASDREAARTCLEEIMRRFPESELAHAAAQRIAHLTSGQMLAEQKERPRLALKHHDEYIGLRGGIADPRPPEEEPAAAAARLVSRLAEYPEDVEAREELAKVYADRLMRIDLAAGELERLIATPGAGQKETARWLNMLADFHVRAGQDKAAAAAALDRIGALFPKSAAAAQAETRRAYLETEMLKNKKSQSLKLGLYEDNLGLKGGTPGPPD